MSRLRRRVTVSLALVVLSAGLVSVAGCTNTASSGSSSATVVSDTGDPMGSTAIPQNFPAEVPLLDDATIISADSDPSGTFFTISWSKSGDPVELAREYDQALVKAGFTPGTPIVDDTSSLTEYSGNGLTVTVYTLPLTSIGESAPAGMAEVDLTVESAS